MAFYIKLVLFLNELQRTLKIPF